jgi:enamine deaminase RidA (YjgF/YER057c/UK114 family)
MSHRRIRKSNTKDGSHFSELDFDTCKAVRAGNLVFLQGQTGITLDGNGFVGAGDPAAQAENAMLCVRTLLEEAGAGMEDVCKITTYVTDHSYRSLVYPVIARHLKGVHVASTGTIVKALATPEIDFEIDVFAVIPEERAVS